jgi:hypothetical protein
MRTPLNGVIAMTDLLRETQLAESQREIVETLSTSAQLALAQIEEILDAAKIEAGRVQLEARPFDLGKLLTGAVKVILPQARYKGLVVNTGSAWTHSWFWATPSPAPSAAEPAFECGQIYRTRGNNSSGTRSSSVNGVAMIRLRCAIRALASRRRSNPQSSKRLRKQMTR